MIRIFCVNTNRYIDVEGGLSLMQLAVRMGDELPFTPVCAHVNNKTENLSFPIFSPKRVEFLGFDSPSGHRAYIRSLCMILYRALCEVLPGYKLRIEHSISSGYLCHVFNSDDVVSPLPEETLAALHNVMSRIVAENHPFVYKEAPTEEVIEIFRCQGLHSKVELLETTGELYTHYYTLDGIADSYYSVLAPSTGFIRTFNLIPYHDGFLLMGPDHHDPALPACPVEQEKMYEAYKDYLLLNRTIKVSDVGQLNRAVQHRHTPELINVAEAMH